jgi:single-stranded-DNA-specific exonuclease
MSGRRIGANDISWLLAPVINAAGRMGNPQKALDLLMEKDPRERDRLAAELVSMNEERKKIGEEIWAEVEPAALKNMQAYHNKLAVAYSSSIPRGVTGIMANRLLKRFNVPALVVSLGEEIFTASLRSTRGYDLRFLLEPCSGLFIDRLKSKAAEINLSDEEDGETLKIDAELPLSYLNPEIFTLLDRFEPFGEGNEPITFLARSIKISEISLMGKPEAKHVKLTLDTQSHKWPAVYWQAADKVKRDFDLGDNVDVAFRITRNYFKGIESPQLIISDLKRSGE